MLMNLKEQHEDLDKQIKTKNDVTYIVGSISLAGISNYWRLY